MLMTASEVMSLLVGAGRFCMSSLSHVTEGAGFPVHTHVSVTSLCSRVDVEVGGEVIATPTAAGKEKEQLTLCFF